MYFKVLNYYVFVCYIFISELTLPIKFYTGSSIVVWILSALLVAFFFISGQFKLGIKQFLLIILILCYFVFFYFIGNGEEHVLTTMIEFVKLSLIPILLFIPIIKSFKESSFEYLVFLSVAKNVAIIVFFILILFVGNVSQSSINTSFINYMEFGIGLSKVFLFIALYITFNYSLSRLKLLFYILICLFSFAAIALFGNRGSLLVVIFSVTFLYLMSNVNVKTKLSFLLLLLLFIVSLASSLKYIVDKVVWTLNDIGVDSYFFYKLQLSLESGLFSSVGEREQLLNDSIRVINSNYGLPLGPSYFHIATGFNYPHNIIVDLIMNFGVLGGLAIILYVFYHSLKLRNIHSKIIIVMFLYAFTLLLFSQTFWNVPFFWFIFFYFLEYNNTSKIS